MKETHEVKCSNCGKISFINVNYIVKYDLSNVNYIRDRLEPNYLIRNCDCDCIENDALTVYKELPFSMSRPR